MASYAFSRDAREDLIGIWLYTREQWGPEFQREVQADRYQADLHECCRRVALGFAATKAVDGIRDVRSHHCRHHYIFTLAMAEDVIVLAVLHERMDLIERLKDRL